MQMLMYAMKVTKKAVVLMSLRAFLISYSSSDLVVLHFLQSYHNSLFLYFWYNNLLHLI